MVFIPAYRCASQIRRVIAQFTPEVAAYFAEIVVVENRSPDNTLIAAKEALANVSGCKVTLLQNDENYSLGGSHKVAFNYCLEKKHTHIVVLHGDDQGDIRDILPWIDKGMHETYESLLGARFAPGSQLQGYSGFRTLGNIVFNAMISFVTKFKVYDMGAGLNIYKAGFLRDKFYLLFPDDLTFNVYMLYYSIWKKSPTLFFPLSWREDDQVSNAKIFRQGWHILGLTLKFVRDPCALFTPKCGGAVEYSSTSIPLQQGN